ncbi:PucR family transcriptional regulator [Nocardia sp. NPDC127606]|uniref:PucR family transcriptional regulator n=1 Tax=Nocardia sp. NPDC127606 TaxID=3345406 RepID=UPI003639374D
MTDIELDRLTMVVEAQLPTLAENAYRTILERIPIYRTGEFVSAADLRWSIEENLRALVHAIGHTGTPMDLAAPAETGRRRATQGAPLPEVLQAYRISFSTVWEAFVEQARRTEVAALLGAASRIWQLTDEHAVALTESYRATTAQLLLTQHQRRSALVEALLTGHPSPDGGPAEAATLLGLPPDAEFVVVAADTRELAEESLPGIEGRLLDYAVVSGWRLGPALQAGVVALRADQREVTLEVLRQVASARVGVSPEYSSLAETPRALELAMSALATMPVGRVGVAVFGSRPLEALLARAPEERRRLVNQVLGQVLQLPVEDRNVLLETLSAYLDYGGSAESAAEILHCHSNTVRYRLRRLQELTGRSFSDPRDIAELAAAAASVHMNPRTAMPGKNSRGTIRG